MNIRVPGTAWFRLVHSTPTTAGPEDPLRQRPDVLVSADCATAIRSLAYG